jgi:G:T-mismatch repair DNA endonuclease (very short patch repair protein)
MKGKNPLRGIVKPENTPWEGLLYEGTVFCLQTFKNITKIQISEIIDRDPEAVRKELDRIIKKSSLSHWIIVTRDENNKKVFNSTPELKEISLKVACTIGRMTWDVYARIDLQVQDKLDKQKPNKPEYYLIDLLKNLSLNYRYVGNGKPENRIKINGKNPDFINEKDKTIIEFFGDRWHGEEFRKEKGIDTKTNIEHENERIKTFKDVGYRCLVIWESELKDEDLLVNKIINFSKGLKICQG